MKNLKEYLTESSLDDEMKEWKKRENTAFYRALTDIHHEFIKTIVPEEDEFGFKQSPISSAASGWVMTGRNEKRIAEYVIRTLRDYDFIGIKDDDIIPNCSKKMEDAIRRLISITHIDIKSIEF